MELPTKVDESSDTGNPSSPYSMAGVRICSKVSFPLPNLSTASTQPAAAPGTVTACTLVIGMLPVTPSGILRSLRIVSSVTFPPERPEPFMACTFLALAS